MECAQRSMQLARLLAAEHGLHTKTVSFQVRIADEMRSLAEMSWERNTPFGSLPPLPLVERVSFWNLYTEEPDRKLMALML